MTEETPIYEPEEPRLRWSENPDGCPIVPEEKPIPYGVEDLIGVPQERLERMLNTFQD